MTPPHTTAIVDRPERAQRVDQRGDQRLVSRRSIPPLAPDAELVVLAGDLAPVVITHHAPSRKYLLLTIALIGQIGRASIIADVRHCFIS